MYSFHLFLISSLSTRSLPLLSFIVPIFGQNIPLIFLTFLKRSLVFPLLLFSSIFMHCSLKKPFLSLYVILWNSAFCWMCLSISSRILMPNPKLYILIFNFTAIVTIQALIFVSLKCPSNQIGPICLSFLLFILHTTTQMIYS